MPEACPSFYYTGLFFLELKNRERNSLASSRELLSYDGMTVISLVCVHVCELFTPCLSAQEFSNRCSNISAVIGTKIKVFSQIENARHMLSGNAKEIFTYH